MTAIAEKLRKHDGLQIFWRTLFSNRVVMVFGTFCMFRNFENIVKIL